MTNCPLVAKASNGSRRAVQLWAASRRKGSTIPIHTPPSCQPKPFEPYCSFTTATQHIQWTIGMFPQHLFTPHSRRNVWMKQASGHEVKGKENWVYLLIKALYGTKQAA